MSLSQSVSLLQEMTGMAFVHSRELGLSRAVMVNL